MFQKSIAIFAIAIAIFFSTSATHVQAEANWDIDFDLYVGVPALKYEVWVDPPNGPPYLECTHSTQYDASWMMFKLFEWNLVPAGSTAWIETVSYTKWIFWLNFETYAQATTAAADWEALNMPTKIVGVFGGYKPPTTTTPYNSAANTNYALNLAVALDDDDNRSPRRGR